MQYEIDQPTTNVTLVAARPTRGVFQVDGWGELNINVFYGAVTRQVGDATNAGGVAAVQSGVQRLSKRRREDRQSSARRSSKPIAIT